MDERAEEGCRNGAKGISLPGTYTEMEISQVGIMILEYPIASRKFWHIHAVLFSGIPSTKLKWRKMLLEKQWVSALKFSLIDVLSLSITILYSFYRVEKLVASQAQAELRYSATAENIETNSRTPGLLLHCSHVSSKRSVKLSLWTSRASTSTCCSCNSRVHWATRSRSSLYS